MALDVPILKHFRVYKGCVFNLEFQYVYYIRVMSSSIFDFSRISMGFLAMV